MHKEEDYENRFGGGNHESDYRVEDAEILKSRKDGQASADHKRKPDQQVNHWGNNMRSCFG